MSEELPPPNGGPGDIWNRVLRAALAMPNAQVDRKAFLRKELSKHVTKEVWQRAIETTPAEAGVNKDTIRRVAASSIKRHKAEVSSVSFVVSIPGGWWIAGAVPADMTQFFWHAIVILQKLAYLYGWPDLLSEDGELDDETLHILTIFVGVMLGVESAAKVLSDLAEHIAAQVLKRLPQQALTKWGLFELAREIAKWIGIKLTKEAFARYLSKVVPILSGIIAGTVTWISFSLMANRLATHLETLPLAGADDD